MPKYSAILALILLAVPITIANPSASVLIDLIRSGHLEEARHQLQQYSDGLSDKNPLLYAQALIESDGNKSFQLLSTAAGAEVSPEFQHEERYLMALYLMTANKNSDLLSILQESSKKLDGRYRPDMLRLEGWAYSNLNSESKAERLWTLVAKENPNGDLGLWGKLDLARLLYRSKKYDAAQKLCQKLAKSKSNEIAYQALYMLSCFCLEQNQIEDAISYYNLLRDGYPESIGLDDLDDRFGRIEKTTDDQTAEKITGTIYSVQVGVFSIQENAAKMAARMKKYGESVNINQKTISDKKYYVVYVGRFLSTERAVLFRARLESAEKESFQVVAR
ncbi:MAG: SPOR domain-containing protein [candidate division Zixibacteria bacterium]|nr:SPOR domain-containing protein [candidate division Zixibacteria bacterium]